MHVALQGEGALPSAVSILSWPSAQAWCCALAQEELFIKFAEFEEKVKEVDRARAIYRYALDHIPREQVRRPSCGPPPKHCWASMTLQCLCRALPLHTSDCLISRCTAL